MAHLATSALAAVRVLPISVVMVRATPSASASRMSAAARIQAARWAKEVVRRASKPVTARPRAASTWSGDMGSKVFRTSPVAGFVVEIAILHPNADHARAGRPGDRPEAANPHRNAGGTPGMGGWNAVYGSAAGMDRSPVPHLSAPVVPGRPDLTILPAGRLVPVPENRPSLEG